MSDATYVKFTAKGMVSSLGDVLNGCAAARAGLSRPAELSLAVTLADEIMPVSLNGYPCHQVQGFQEYGRLSFLAYLAVADLVKQFPRAAVGESSIIVNLPASCERTSLDRQCASTGKSGRKLFSECFSNLLEARPLKLSGRSVYIFEEGGAGIGKALVSAQQILTQGKSRSCLVISVDSYLDEVTLEDFVLSGRVRTPDVSQGFLPGEGAVAVLLETSKSEAEPLAYLSSIAHDVEDYEFPLPFELFVEEESLVDATNDDSEELEEPPVLDTPGRVYARVIESAVAHLAPEGKWLMINDLNGEVLKANEWGQMMARISSNYDFVRESEWDTPALYFGHTGSASMGVAICMSLHGAVRGYLKNHKALICGGSDRGLRAAITLQL
ncbi:hypothetical protein [Hahella ganghwensis]|uniref:hypothetical protein n=1 Tax=Hahella ganghwensis TaxID=286420 RepID=UPI00035F4BDB|nr:hypothetical protein [Hahella ganghwensis]